MIFPVHEGIIAVKKNGTAKRRIIHGCLMKKMGLKSYRFSVNWCRIVPEAFPKTSMGWVVDGRCLYWTIRQYWERYHLPVMVTENGMAANDAVGSDGCVHDGERIDFLKAFLPGVGRAIDEGIPVLGYQHWSVMDNMEWCEGYGPRFGLIHVDYQTQKRTIKDSGRFYADVIRTNGENLK
jgi:beta-glucosidase